MNLKLLLKSCLGSLGHLLDCHHLFIQRLKQRKFGMALVFDGGFESKIDKENKSAFDERLLSKSDMYEAKLC